jgi:hypothetical protein
VEDHEIVSQRGEFEKAERPRTGGPDINRPNTLVSWGLEDFEAMQTFFGRS